MNFLSGSVFLFVVILTALTHKAMEILPLAGQTAQIIWDAV